MYAKLENGVLIKAPQILQYNGYVYHNPNGDVCLANGYYEVIEAPYPKRDEGLVVTYVPHYEQLENKIVQTWVEFVEEESVEENIVDDAASIGPIEDESAAHEVIKPTEEELAKEREYLIKYTIISKIREVYSVDDEIAILRQRDSKPEEFQEYYDFVEQCKAEAKAAFE